MKKNKMNPFKAGNANLEILSSNYQTLERKKIWKDLRTT